MLSMILWFWFVFPYMVETLSPEREIDYITKTTEKCFIQRIFVNNSSTIPSAVKMTLISGTRQFSLPACLPEESVK
jgi:hypothetical protein